MTDPRYKKLARLLVNYSTELKKGDRILLDMIDVPDEFTIELIRAVRAAGAHAVCRGPPHARCPRAVAGNQRKAGRAGPRHRVVPHEKDAGLHRHPRQRQHASENSDVPSDRMQLYSRIIRPVQDYRVNQDALVRVALADARAWRRRRA